MIYVLLLICIASLFIMLSILGYSIHTHRKIISILLVLPTLISASFMLLVLSKSHESVEVIQYNELAKAIRFYQNKDGSGGTYTMVIRRDTVSNYEREITRSTYNYFKTLWKKKDSDEIIFSNAEDSENYQEIRWDGVPSHSLTKTRSVISEVTISDDWFKSCSNLTSTDASKLGLFEKETVSSIIMSDSIILPRQQRLIYGLNKEVSDSLYRAFSFLGSLDKNFRPILLVWRGRDESLIKFQKDFWNNGCENEIIFCIGLDDEDTIIWSGYFGENIGNTFGNEVINSSLKVGENLDLNSYRKDLRYFFRTGRWNNVPTKSFSNITIAIISFVIFALNILALVVVIVSRKITKIKEKYNEHNTVSEGGRITKVFTSRL